MSDDESQSGPAETSQSVTHGVGELAPKMNDNLKDLKKQRAQLRGKITRSINRVKKCIHQGAEMRKRIEKEIQIRKDFELARECHAQMYEYVEESQVQAMDNWEDILTNEFYGIEENVEEFL
jgi:septal ring factor EnvC (AmiA/AmiB activator)